MSSEQSHTNLNKALSLYIPGKTFLVGEYAVLIEGEALGLATSPCFTVSENLNAGFHPLSAAGLLLKDEKAHIEIMNPYSVGGFGQSTAEFIAAWFLKNGAISNLNQIFKNYLEVFDNSNLSDLKPSGADIVAQLLGYVTHFKNVDGDVSESVSISWPFLDLGFYVVSTRLKIATHDHIASIDRKKTLLGLPELSSAVIQTVQGNDEDLFLDLLSEWTKQLQSRGLQHDKVIEIKAELEKHPEVKLVKPCGALGADVVLVFYNQEHKQRVKEIINGSGALASLNQLTIRASEEDLTQGVLYA